MTSDQPAPPAEKIPKYAFIDAARGIAILMVVFVHSINRADAISPMLWWIGSYGNMGVQLFFVASAYTLCLSHVHRRHEPDALKFYFIRRYFRIAPLYYLAMVLFFLFNYHRAKVDPGFLSDYSVASVVSNILFLHGVVPTVTASLVPGGWSIGTEMLFYVLFPALFAAAHRLESWRPRASLLLLLPMIVVDGVVQFLAWPPDHPGLVNNSPMYGQILNQLPVFLLGIFAFFQATRPGAVARGPVVSFALFVAATTVAMLARFARGDFTFVFIPMLAAIAFLFLLVALRAIEDPRNLLCRIGRVSFSMYIFHFPIVHAMSEAAARLDRFVPSPDVLLFVGYVASVAVTFAVATLSERFIERPGIRVGQRCIRALAARHPAAAAPIRASS